MSEIAVPPESVVVVVDGGPEDDLIVECSCLEAARRGEGLHVLHVYPWLAAARSWEPSDALEEAERIVGRAADRASRANPRLTVKKQGFSSIPRLGWSMPPFPALQN